ncbi:hypothetical protein FB446DRAFT_846753 [Lentinula raphanica]|nr:hypothetical protein FB446DRAFT_846753 [Lentinula raphanica]
MSSKVLTINEPLAVNIMSNLYRGSHSHIPNTEKIPSLRAPPPYTKVHAHTHFDQMSDNSSPNQHTVQDTQRRHASRLRRVVLPIVLGIISLGGLIVLSCILISLSGVESSGGLSIRADDDNALRRDRLYLIIVFVGLFLVVILGICLSAWCCRGVSFILPTITIPLYRVVCSLSLSTSSSSDDYLDSSVSVTSTSTSSSSSSSTRERQAMARIHSLGFAPSSSRSKHTHNKTETVLIRARNANIPIVLRPHHKKTTGNHAVSRRRHTSDDDSDYEQSSYLQSQQRSKKQKVKSQEQLDAEERRMLERKAELADDPLLDASRMRPDKVWCLPCNKYIQIDSRRQFYATLWYKHRSKRHSDVPLKRSEMESADMDVDSEEFTPNPSNETPAAGRVLTEPSLSLAVPVIDDALASNILAEMYSKAKGLRLLSLAAAALA